MNFTEAEIDPVKTYLDLLSAYAQQLTYLVSDEPVARVDAATSELVIAASGLSATAFPALNQNVVQQGLQGGRAITAFLIEETLNLELPPIIDRMQPAVESVAELLAAHLGYLRTIAQTRVTEISKAQSVLLSAFRDDQRVSSAQRLHLLNDAIADQAKFAEMDQLLAAAQDVLPRMVRAHATLRSPASTSATAAVESFENYERRLLALYQTIRRGG